MCGSHVVVHLRLMNMMCLCVEAPDLSWHFSNVLSVRIILGQFYP